MFVLKFSNHSWASQTYLVGYCPIVRGSEYQRFNVPLREDAKGLPFTDVDVKAVLVADWLQLRFSYLIFPVLQENQGSCVCLKPRRRTLLGDLDRA